MRFRLYIFILVSLFSFLQVIGQTDHVKIYLNNNSLSDVCDSLLIFTTSKDFFKEKEEGTILRSYDIKFSFYELHLDTTIDATVSTLDTIAEYLKNNNISVEVGTHLSIKFWEGKDKNYDHMPNEVINYLVDQGVDESQLIGKNYFNYSPIIKFSDKSNYKSEDVFWEKEWNTNNRVEFKILTID